MSKDDIVRQVIEAVVQVQQASGRSAEGIEPDTRPFKDVEGFDSLSGIEATVLLSETLGRDLPDSVFTPEQGDHVLSVNEVADRVLGYTNAAKVTG